MEKYNINITIQVDDGMKFDKKLIEFLETNVTEYEFELKRVYTEEEEITIKGLISKTIRNNGCNHIKEKELGIMDERLIHLEKNQSKTTLPMTKDCKYCTHYYEIQCHAGGFKLNQEKIVDKCYYSEGKRKTLEALKPMIDSGELEIYEFESVPENIVKDPAEELRQLLSKQPKTLADYIMEERSK